MKSRTQKRIEEYMSMRNLLTYHEAVEKARIDHLKYLKDLFVNLIKEYGEIDGKKIHINGVHKLIGKEVVATDLRAGACLVLAGLKAEGTTVISDVEHILRGYENIIGKLTNVGAEIELIEE